jgi:hypothetical protein
MSSYDIPFLNSTPARILFFCSLFIISIFYPFQTAFGASLSISWNPNGEGDLDGYKIYYGTSPGNYGPPTDVGDVTSYALSGLTEGVRYYIALTAYDTSNNESGKSGEVNGIAHSITTTSTPGGTTTSTPATTTLPGGTTTSTPATTTIMPGVTTSIIPGNDSTPPTGSVSINNGLLLTHSLTVILTLSGIDGGVELDENALMSFSNDNQSWSYPEPYATSKMWTLSPGEGEKEVYVKFCDAAGNWMTAPAQDQIIYEISENACDEPQKLLAGTTTVSSQSLPFYGKENAVDGNPSTTWSTVLSLFKKDEFITLDLGALKRISWFSMQAASTLFGTDFFPVNFKIEISKDNSVWEEISTEEGYAPPMQSTRMDSWDCKSIECRFIRVSISKTKSIFLFFKVAQIAEIEVYGCDISSGQLPALAHEDRSINEERGAVVVSEVSGKDRDTGSQPSIPGKPVVTFSE